ncbi:MAG: DUF87 domain-containing protein [Xanthomonadales bacterium]|nr:DUF87 domain-containing protein [Xanthomonadales bacterium]
MEDSQDVVIGKVTRVAVAEIQASFDPEALASVEEGIAKGAIPAGRVGSYVSIRDSGRRILARVQSCDQDDQGKLLAVLLAVGELSKEGVFFRGVAHYPRPGAQVEAAGDRLIRKLFRTIAQGGLSLGTIPALGNTPVGIDPNRFFNRHVAVLGQSGSGKSWATATIIQRAVEAMPNAHIVLLDLHGEYAWTDDEGATHTAFKDKTARYLDARDLEIPYWLLTFAELSDLLIDRDDENAPTHSAFIRENLEDLKRGGQRKDDYPHITVDSPVYYSLEELFDRIKEANDQMLDFGKTPGPLYGLFDKLLTRFESRLTDNRYQFLFKPRKRTSSESMEGLLRDFVGLGEPRAQITIIDLSSVPFDVRPTVCAQIGRVAFEFNYWNRRYREFPLFLVCEEAHAYIPRERGSEFEGARKSMERIAKEGRKYGVGLCVISQRPKEVSETVLAQCGNFLCLRMTNPDDQDYVRQLVPESEGKLIDILAGLSRGEVMALGEGIPIPIRFRFYKPDPAPHSRDVNYATGWKDGPEDLDVARIVQRWRWQRR